VAVLEQLLVPAEYLRTVTTTTVDKRAVLDTLKTTGEVVPDVEIVRGTRDDPAEPDEGAVCHHR
jgi:hypothetical protein